MSQRTPNFIVVGLIIIMFVLGFFYMSCSSKTAELRQSLVDFEDRVRSLTLRSSHDEKQIDLLNTTKHELEERQTNLQKQLEQKDTEINELNIKLNEQNAELQSLKTDKHVLEQQIEDLKNASDTLHSKNFAMQKFQESFDEQKSLSEQQVNELKNQIKTYQEQIAQLQNILEKPLLNLVQKSKKLFLLNETQAINQNSSLVNNSDVQPRLEQSLNNASINETQIKENPPLDLKINESNLTNNTQNDIANNNEQKNIELNKYNIDEEEQQLDNVESN